VLAASSEIRSVLELVETPATDHQPGGVVGEGEPPQATALLLASQEEALAAAQRRLVRRARVALEFDDRAEETS
jgi:hypothetical protein